MQATNVLHLSSDALYKEDPSALADLVSRGILEVREEGSGRPKQTFLNPSHSSDLGSAAKRNDREARRLMAEIRPEWIEKLPGLTQPKFLEIRHFTIDLLLRVPLLLIDGGLEILAENSTSDAHQLFENLSEVSEESPAFADAAYDPRRILGVIPPPPTM